MKKITVMASLKMTMIQMTQILFHQLPSKQENLKIERENYLPQDKIKKANDLNMTIKTIKIRITGQITNQIKSANQTRNWKMNRSKNLARNLLKMKLKNHQKTLDKSFHLQSISKATNFFIRETHLIIVFQRQMRT